jgi:NTE family protein
MAASQFRNLVFEGGGVLGIAYAGALRELEKEHVLADIERVAGASAGAITACLLAIGYSADEIQEVVGSTSFDSFMDAPGGFFGSLARSFTKYGWYRGEAFSDWLRDRFTQKQLSPELTFAELEQLADAPANKASTAPGKFRKLYVVASDLSRGLVRQYDATDDDTKDLPIWLAVRASMSIPFFFSSVREAILGTSSTGDPLERGRILVDGGVTWNYPIDLFDDKRFIDASDSVPLVTARPIEDLKYRSVYDETHVYNKQTLGLRVDTADEVAEYKGRLAADPKPITNVVAYCMSLINFMRSIALKSHLKKHDWHRTIFLDAGTIPFTKFDLTAKEIAELVCNGEKGCKDYFGWFNGTSRKEGDEIPINKVGAITVRATNAIEPVARA